MVKDRIEDQLLEPTTKGAPPGYRRVTALFSEKTIEALEELKKESGSISNALRDAISLSKWFYDERKVPGTRILIERNGSIREVVLMPR